jgi:hypothetical protein
MAKTLRTASTRDDIAQTVADITGHSPRYVRMVRNGDRDNATIENLLVEYGIGKSNLIKHLEKLVPLNSKTTRHGRKKN